VISPRCLVVQSQLSRFVDGALSAEETRAMRDHLALCVRCREAEGIARAIPFMLSSSLHPPAPPTLFPQVLGAVNRVWRRERIERRATAMVTVLMIVLAGAVVLDGHFPLRARQATPSSQGSAGDTIVVSQSPVTSLAATHSAPPIGSGPATHLTPVSLDPPASPAAAPARCSGKRATGAAASRSPSCGGTATPKARQER
jgi:anti-sigma factor RsiW